MTIRKQILIGVMVITLLVVILNSFLLGRMTDDVFKEYMTTSYNQHLEEIYTYAKEVLMTRDIQDYSVQRELTLHLQEPIIGITLRDNQNRLLARVLANNASFMGMQHGMMSNSGTRESLTYEIMEGESHLGTLTLVISSSVEGSLAVQSFTRRLVVNSLITGLAVLLVIAFLAIIFSDRLTRSLRQVAEFATSIREDKPINMKKSKILEVNRIQRALIELSTRLSLKHKARTELVDKLIHEVRTPMTILKSHLEGIEDGYISTTSDQIKLLQNQVDKVNHLIEGLPEMMSYSGSQQELIYEKLSLVALLEQISKALTPQLEKENMEVVADLPKEEVETDQGLLTQVFYNIMMNSIKYADTGSRIYVSGQGQEDEIVIHFQDEGPGIAPEALPHIFRPYYRGQERGTGQGLGLFIVKENIERLGGQITASVNEQGTCFTLSIPKHPKI